MTKPFGVVPLSPLMTYVGTPIANGYIHDPLLVHQLVSASGCLSFLGLQIPVIFNLNILSWRAYLKEYCDQQLAKFGFRLDFDRDSNLVSSEQNHSTAAQFHEHVTKYINEELSHGATLGPFHHKPMQLHISLFMARENTILKLGEP